MKLVLGVLCSVALVLVVLYPNLYLGAVQVRNEMAGLDTLIDPHDPYVHLVGEQLRITGESPESWVARSITWQSDYDTYGNLEYWARPGETIVAGKGDCEDRAILTASLNEYLSLDAKVVVQLDHVYVEKDGQAYFGVSETETVRGFVWGIVTGIPTLRKIIIVAGLAAIWAKAVRS